MHSVIFTDVVIERGRLSTFEQCSLDIVGLVETMAESVLLLALNSIIIDIKLENEGLGASEVKNCSSYHAVQLMESSKAYSLVTAVRVAEQSMSILGILLLPYRVCFRRWMLDV